MATYEAGATVERRYPGPDADTARGAAEPQIAAFLAAGFTIASERWLDDAASAGGAPIGDAIASGPLSYLAGHGGALLITYRATIPTDLPVAVPAYTLSDPRAQNLRAWSQIQVVAAIVFIVIFGLVFLTILGQMNSASSGMPLFGH
jgi:hypothetical protein